MKKILIYQTKGNKTEIEVRFEKGTVWLNRRQIGTLFGRDVKTIGKHINNVFREGELGRSPVVANFATTASDGKSYQVEHYNLDVIISVGYRVKSLQGTRFRIWATGRLKDYLVQGYAINEKRLQQKNQQVQYLKTGIRILSRAIEEQAEASVNRIMKYFAEGLSLLDRYDNGQLDVKGRTIKKAVYPDYDEYMVLINGMEPEFHSALFGRARDAASKAQFTR